MTECGMSARSEDTDTEEPEVPGEEEVGDKALEQLIMYEFRCHEGSTTNEQHLEEFCYRAVQLPQVSARFCDDKFNKECHKFDLRSGFAMDLRTGFDADREEDQK